MGSTSFLDILKELKKSVDEVSPEAVVEFLRYGHLFVDRTFFDDIKRVAGNAILHISNQGIRIKNIEILKQRGIIRNNIKVEDLEEILFGRVFTLGQFYQYCEKL
ncbi:MAG: hypothetical protein WA977_02340 [Halobacteriota archaeon]